MRTICWRAVRSVIVGEGWNGTHKLESMHDAASISGIDKDIVDANLTSCKNGHIRLLL